jgi:cytoskeletal protein CcmA (bactofilin family)
MSQIIKIKSGTSGQPDSLARGELAINVSNGAFYYGDAQSATTGTWFFSGASAETFSATTTVIDTQLNISGNTFFEGALSGTGAITTVGSISTDGDLTGDNALIRDNIQHVGDTTTEISFGNGGGEIDFRTNNGSRIDLTNSGVRLGGANSRVTTILDEDNMSSDSDTSLATQQSIKAYVDSQVATSDTLQEVTDNGATTTNALQFGSNLGISGDTFFEGTLSGTGSVTAVGNITTDGDVTTDNVLVRDNIQHVGDTTNEISFATNTQDFRTNNTSRLDISNSGVRLGGANSRVTTILDEDAAGS